MSLAIVVSPENLREIGPKQLKFVDLRPIEDYAAGHIPNAVHLAPSLLGRAEDGANGLLPDQAGVNALAISIGLKKDEHVIAYDQGRTTAAARLIWVLHAYGFNNISWLNGGFPAWERAQQPTSSEPATITGTDVEFQFSAGNMLRAEELMQSLDNDKNLRMLDVRSDGEYAGTDVRSARGGRVPGAHHVEWTNAFEDNGELKPDDTLRAMFAAQDIQPSHHVSVYCQTHQRSAVTYVVLKHLGFENVTALDGAWSTWGNRTDTPIENETAKPA